MLKNMLLARQGLRQVQFVRPQQANRYFSTEDVKPTEEELAKNRDEWDEKYQDECFRFEKEWKIIADQVDQKQRVFLESELGDL